MKVVYIDLDNEKITGEKEFETTQELKDFLELVNEYGVESSEAHVEHYIKFNPVKSRFEIQYEQ